MRAGSRSTNLCWPSLSTICLNRVLHNSSRLYFVVTESLIINPVYWGWCYWTSRPVDMQFSQRAKMAPKHQTPSYAANSNVLLCWRYSLRPIHVSKILPSPSFSPVLKDWKLSSNYFLYIPPWKQGQLIVLILEVIVALCGVMLYHETENLSKTISGRNNIAFVFWNCVTLAAILWI